LPVGAETGSLGRLATSDEIKAWDIDVRPDGVGLPIGGGSVEYGEIIFSEKCASCHGDFGEAVDRWPVLAGGQQTLTDDRPVKTMGSYWPYLSTVWDYIHRAMPFGNSQSLSDDDVYAMVAYLLYMNDLVDEDFTLTNENFTSIELENVNGFFLDNRPKVEYPAFTKDVCMKNCKKDVTITARARIIDVTPDENNNQEIAQTDENSVTNLRIERGLKVFKKCKACHRVGENAKNGVGPTLNGIYGVLIASNPAFKYSNAFKKASKNGVIWNEENLYTFLKHPKGFIKKTKMSYKGLKDEDDILAVIAYIKSFE
jgi:cytochrome c